MMYPTKDAMFARGLAVMGQFCELNSLPTPVVVQADSKEWAFGVCAYYRKDVTTICLSRCASIGTAGMQWSYPGHSVDRTPYGVLQHELGHHVDFISSTKRGAYFGDFSIAMRKRVGEEPLTSYCPNDAEWFAEMFRLFVTNPDLLLHLRPRTHADLAERFKPLFHDGWRERISKAPDRTIVSIERKLAPKPPPRARAAKASPAAPQPSLLDGAG